jgi:hypothetical protein
MRRTDYLLILIVFVCSIFTSCSGGDNKSEEANDLVKVKSESTAFSAGETTSTSASNSFTFIPTDTLNIKLTPFIPDYPDVGVSGKRLLATRLNSAVTRVGFGGDGGNPRFIIGPDINLLSKNMTGTSPTKFANTYEVTLMSADVVSETIFASYTFEVKGVGDSPAKSFINGFRDFTLENEAFFNFLNQFYALNCDKIMLQAESEAKTRNFDKAFSLVNAIPGEATDCYERAMTKRQEYFQLSLNADCQTLLAKMKAEFGKANDPSAAGFNEAAMSYYALIDQSAKCYPEAEKLYQNYLSKLNPKAKRDWDYQMRQYQDKIDQIQFSRDTAMARFDYMERKIELEAKAEIEGNKKLLQKYQYDQLPWLRRVFHLGKHDPFDGIEN